MSKELRISFLRSNEGRTSSWDDNTTGSQSSNWDDKNAGMGNISGNAASAGSWDAQAPNAWQQQQKNKQIMGSATGKLSPDKLFRLFQYCSCFE